MVEEHKVIRGNNMMVGTSTGFVDPYVNSSTNPNEFFNFEQHNSVSHNSDLFWKPSSPSSSSKPIMLTGTGVSNFGQLDESSLQRCVLIPCESNERPSQGLSLSLSSTNPSTIGIQPFELVRPQQQHHHQQPMNMHAIHDMMIDAYSVRSSRYLVPTQDLLNEFCNLGKNDQSTKAKAHRTNQWQDHENLNNNASSSKTIPLNSLEFLELQKRKSKLLHMLEEDPIPCDLLWPYPGHEFRVARGKVYPTRDAILHGSCISEGYIKVQVDTVEDAFKAIPVPKTTETVSILEHTILEFIEWPRKKIKTHQTISPRHSVSRSPRSPSMPCQPPISDLSSSSCYRPQMEEDLMTFQHQIPIGGYMSLLESQVALHPQMQSHLVTVEPDKPKQTQEERNKERLDKLKYRPKIFKEIARLFTKCKNINIPIDAPHNMYVKPWQEWIEYEAILDLHVEAKVDITFIHWWAMYLHSIVKGLHHNRCVFLNPHLIASSECLRNSEQVVDHIISTKGQNPKKDIYVAPYLQGENHWLLFVVCPNLRRGYIVDSSKGDNTDKSYYFPQIVERAFEINFDWTMVECFQQEGLWECGYYMMKFMYDLAMYKQADFPKHLWDDARHLKPSEIDQVALMTLREFYKCVVEPLDATAPQ